MGLGSLWCLHREHCKSAVLQLLDLQLCQGVGVACQLQGVESATGVKGVQTLSKGSPADPVALDQAHEDDLQVSSTSQTRHLTRFVEWEVNVNELWHLVKLSKPVRCNIQLH